MITHEQVLRPGLDCQEHGRVCLCVFRGHLRKLRDITIQSWTRIRPQSMEKIPGVPVYGMKNKTHTKPYMNYSCLDKQNTHTYRTTALSGFSSSHSYFTSVLFDWALRADSGSHEARSCMGLPRKRQAFLVL